MTIVVVGVMVRVVGIGGPREVMVVVVAGNVTVVVLGFGLTEVVTTGSGGRYELVSPQNTRTLVVVSVTVVGIVCVTVSF